MGVVSKLAGSGQGLGKGLLLGGLLAFSLQPVSALADQGEGIGVRGEWRITVYDADGTVSQERQFLNALEDPGLISAILSNTPPQGSLCPGAQGWQVSAETTGVDTQTRDCVERTIGEGILEDETIPPLATPGLNEDVFTLSRSFSVPPSCVTPGSTYEITRVYTSFFSEFVSYEGGCFFAYLYSNFTGTTLETPLSGIAADQTVVIDVNVSFETASP